MALCSICIDEIIPESKDSVQIWKCNHTFHKSCIKNWTKNCPYCRCENKIIKKNPTFNIEYFKSFARKIDSGKYINDWEKKDCISDEHDLTFHSTYSIIGVCETCQTVQSFNLKH